MSEPSGEGQAQAKPDIAALTTWLIDGARETSRSQDVLSEFCARLVAEGAPLYRVNVVVRTLHPLVMGRSFLWRTDKPVEVYEAPFEIVADQSFIASPIRRVHDTGEPIRRRLADPDCPMDFPILADFLAEGVTDYLALPLVFTNGEIHVATYSTRQAGGFSDGQIAALKALASPFARVAEVRALRRTAVSLLNAYVGRDAGEQILSGQIRRGDSEQIRAAIWLSDMRGFTKRADTMAPAELIETLNRFYDRLVPAIEAEGGEVLKFMGDGLLAIFRIDADGGIGPACARALAAARQAEASVAELSAAIVAEGGEELRFGLALHIGEALYGNIGAGERLDFTCIGPAINRAARLEKIAARLGRAVVASAAFAAHAPDDFLSLGEFELAGFREPERVYGLQTKTAGS